MIDRQIEACTVRAAIIAPTFNNAGTLTELLDQLLALNLPVFIINDGSTDDTAALLSNREKAASLIVLTHDRNRGKAEALRTGFLACSAAGFTHAISIDTDGQHAPQDVPRLLAEALADPGAFILGSRDESGPDYPFLSRWGRRLSNLAIRLECGQRVEDSQCGLRVYPLRRLNFTQCSAGHYGFETEVITRACWDGVSIRSLRVDCRYLPIEQRVSHFKPWRDSARALRMHLRLLRRSLVPWRAADNHGGAISIRQLRAGVRQSIRGINPLSAWKQLRSDAVGRNDFALGFALGVFIANLPLYGLQTLLGLFTARRLHLHPLAVVAGTNLSVPPISPLLVGAAVVVGHLFLHGALPNLAVVKIQLHQHVAGLIGSMLLDWIVGSVCVGGILAIGAFVLVRQLLNVAFGRQSVQLDQWSPVAGGAD